MVWSFSNLHIHNEILIFCLVVGGALAIRQIALRRSHRKEEADEKKWGSGHYENLTSATTDYGALINEARAYREAQKNQNRGREFAETLTLAGLFAAGAIAYLQWAALEKTDLTIGKTDQTARITNRAFVYFEDVTLIGYPPTNAVTLAATAKVTNSGNTPARRVKLVSSCPPRGEGKRQIDPYNLEPLKAEFTPPTFLGPKQNFVFVVCEMPLSTMRELRNGIERFIVIEATYVDAFDHDKVRTTRMTRFITTDDHGGMRLGFAGRHNCSDDDCPK